MPLLPPLEQLHIFTTYFTNLQTTKDIIARLPKGHTQFALAEIAAKIHPLDCIMAGENEIPWWKRKKERLTPKQKRQIERRTEKQHLGQMTHEA